MNRKFLFLLLIVSLFAFACNQTPTANRNAGELPYTKDAKPVADAEIAVIEFADNYGTVKLELYSNVAPKHVARFKELASEGVYNRTQIHRVDPNLGIIQGGDPLSKDDNPANDGSGNSGKPNLQSEFSDIPYDTGILGAARTTDPNTANSQFFIMTKRQPAFDKKYTIFGKVIEGQDVVNLISKVPTASGTERPAAPVIIKSVTIQKK
jgi:cyclophilin family peptidyl-prolyl cis-trans isomerase